MEPAEAERRLTELEPLLADLVFHFCRARGIRRLPDREDLRQEARLAAWRALESWEPEKAQLSTWVHTWVSGALGHWNRNYRDEILRPALKQHIPGPQVMNSTELSWEDRDFVESLPAASADPADQAVFNLDFPCTFRRMHKRLRRLLLLKWSGMSISEIAKREGYLPGSVVVICCRANRRLEKAVG